jgi:hypothetical protein
VLVKFRPYVGALALGIHPEQFDRCREVANFLNQVLEAYPNVPPDRLSLGKLKNDAEFGRDAALLNSITFLNELRKYTSHGGQKDKQRLLKSLGNPSKDEMKEITQTAANRIAETTQLSCLPVLVDLLLAAELGIVGRLANA